MNAIIGGSQERAVYIGDNSEIVLGTNRTVARTLETVKGLPRRLCARPNLMSVRAGLPERDVAAYSGGHPWGSRI
jgi:hypothetical protein